MPWRLPRGLSWYYPWHATAPPTAPWNSMSRHGMPWRCHGRPWLGRPWLVPWPCHENVKWCRTLHESLMRTHKHPTRLEFPRQCHESPRIAVEGPKVPRRPWAFTKPLFWRCLNTYVYVLYTNKYAMLRVSLCLHRCGVG